jgi:hypothetical protein
LTFRRVIIKDSTIICEFAPGQVDHVVRSTFDQSKLVRILEFRENGRKDGLVYREEIAGQKVIERYNGRQDRFSFPLIHLDVCFRLCYRSHTIRHIEQQELNQKFLLQQQQQQQELLLLQSSMNTGMNLENVSSSFFSSLSSSQTRQSQCNLPPPLPLIKITEHFELTPGFFFFFFFFFELEFSFHLFFIVHQRHSKRKIAFIC